jgi:RNA polymerase sigma-70 factor (ECF subfamily)
MSTYASGQALRPGALDPVALRLEQHRPELTGYCYRMLGSPFEAEDAVQETLTRAWRGFDRFKGRSSLRTWLYRIASNVCFDLLSASQRRARPIDISEAVSGDGPAGEILPESSWIQPVPDDRVTIADGDPAQVAVARETIRLAFVAALQHLPPKQRAVLILREALRWEASEVAELLETTVPSVNSALQRARATLAAHDIDAAAQAPEDLDAGKRDLLERYVDAFEAYDMDALTAVIRADANQSMPPYAMWLRGRDDILRWWAGPGAACRGSRLVPTAGANGSPAFGQFRPSGPGGRHEAWSLQVLEIEDAQIVEMTFFLDTKTLFPLFGLPLTLD